MIQDIYLFLSYPKSANLVAQLLNSSNKVTAKIHDGFQCQKFNTEGSIAFVDDATKESIIFKMAEKNISLIGLTDNYINPLIQHKISFQPTLEQLDRVVIAIANEISESELDLSLEGLLPGKSECWEQIKSIVSKSAHTNCSILIHGESGTGKELVARAIHTLSPQSESLFVPVNCGAIPGELIESELFGHEKGAFTGAIAQRVGKFEQVGNGTLFLDEIGDMPFAMQVKLLRVLQERSFEKIGSNRSVDFKARLISATHQCLSTLVTVNKFREDLFYRLNVLPIHLPPLRDRLDDIEVIFSALKKKEGWTFDLSKSSLKALQSLSWPGNIRQFYNLMSRAEVFFSNQTLKSNHINSLLDCDTKMTAK